MFLIAHIGYTLLTAEIIAHLYYWLFLKKKNLEPTDSWGIVHFAFIPLIIGALGPDIIDKLISAPITGYGRYIGHSIPFAILMFILFIVAFRKKPTVYSALILGWIMHIILDTAGFIPWFFPFMNYTFQPKTQTYFQFLLQPYVYYNEIGGFLSLLFLSILYFRRGFTPKSFIQHVFTFTSK
ncbi:MAG: metal-dependent hydrolase [Candidatus Heimdallarchaeaceae archaeon]